MGSLARDELGQLVVFVEEVLLLEESVQVLDALRLSNNHRGGECENGEGFLVLDNEVLRGNDLALQGGCVQHCLQLSVRVRVVSLYAV